MSNKTQSVSNDIVSHKSLKKNFLLNNLRLVLSFSLPLVTFPYISRVLGAEGIGKVEFANSITTYFILFASLGIPTYGIREVARVRDDKGELSKTIAEISLILIAMTFVGYVVYFFAVNFVPTLKVNKILFLVVAPSIFLGDFSFDWFYQGIEDQWFITRRYIFVKIIQLVLIFTLIKVPNDFIKYAAIIVGMNGLSSIFNIIHLRKYVSFSSLFSIGVLNIKKHFKPIIVIFVSTVATSIYTQLDVTMTGVFCGDKEVGIYTAANRIVRIVIALVTSFSSVVIPKIENSFKNGDLESYCRYVNISLRFVLIFAFPCLAGIEVLSDDIIFAFAGKEFEKSILSMRFLSPIILIVGLACFVGLQVLYANRKEKYYTIAVSVAALANFCCNLLLIPRIGQLGAIFGTLVAETIGLLIMTFLGRKILKQAALKVELWKYIFASCVMAGIIFLIKNVIAVTLIVRLVVCVFLGIGVYGSILLILKEQMSMQLLDWIRKRFCEEKKI